MNDTIFRKSSIDRMNSPEQLNDYIHVARPSVWVLLGAIVCLLAGLVVWGVFGTIETKATLGVLAINGSATCYASPETAAKLKEGMSVSVDGLEGTVEAVSTVPVAVNPTSPVMYLSGLEDGFCYEVTLSVPGLANGTYEASVTTESIKPISFIVN